MKSISKVLKSKKFNRLFSPGYRYQRNSQEIVTRPPKAVLSLISVMARLYDEEVVPHQPIVEFLRLLRLGCKYGDRLLYL